MVSDGVRVVMAGLTPVERAAVEAAIQSAQAVSGLPVEHTVRGAGGNLYAARVTPRLRLIYRRAPGRVEVADLLSSGTIDFLLRRNEAGEGAKKGRRVRIQPRANKAQTPSETNAELTAKS